MEKNWYKLDNAAKLFPATYSRKAPTTFRLSAIFYEEVDKEILQKAVDIALERFHPFNVQLKRGIFWYYLERNYSKFYIKKESPFGYQSVNINDDNSYLFNVFYNGKRVCLEIWHALTDANGGMEFLKAICFNYLKLKDVNIENNNTILTNDIPVNEEEGEDSFVKNFNPLDEKPNKVPRTFVISGDFSKFDNIGIIHGLLNVNQVKENAKLYDATITEYIGGCMLYSIYLTYKNNNPKNLPFVLFIPVNTRKIIDSKTLKNFMLYIRSTLNINEEVTLKNTINCIKNTLRVELNEKYLRSVIRGNVPVEKSLVIRSIPLSVKNFVMNLGYKIIGKGTTSIVFSNIGVVNTPEVMKQFVDRFEFGISPSESLPITFSGVSYNNKLVLTLSKKIKDKELIKNFFKLLSEENEVIINTNDLGGQ
ncbi:MAG: hypothetical protein R3Y05_06760 [bacterium]